MHRDNDPAVQWFVGVVAALLLAGYGLWVVASGQVVIKGSRGGLLTLTGIDAVLYGACILALAAAIHCFNFWSNQPPLDEYANTGAAVSLAAFIAHGHRI